LGTIQEALTFYQAGRYQDAQRLYCRVLEQNPQNPDALHLLGLLYLDCGKPEPAAGLISQAIQQRPDVPFFYNTLGNTFRALQKSEQAVASFRQAIRLKPDYGEAFSNLGSALEESGRCVEAIAIHEKAAALLPDRAEIHGNLGNALRSAGRAAEASAAYAMALRLRPGYAEAWMNLGNIYFDCEEYRKAGEHYRQALTHNPRLAAAQSNLGAALNQVGQFKEAESWCLKALEALPGDALAHCNLASILAVTARADLAERHCRRALEIQPGLAEARANLGLALARIHRTEEAEQECRESVRLRPTHPSGYVYLAGVLLLTGRVDEAEEYLKRALVICPSHVRALCCRGDARAAQLDFAGALEWYDKALAVDPETWFPRPARAMVWLAMGDFERGWEEYEWRWKRGDCQPAEFAQPAWDGTAFPGKTVLLHAEQGLGDTIQFIRFIPLVKQLGGKVILACQRPMLPLLAGMESTADRASGVESVPCTTGVDRIISSDSEVPEYDYHLPLLSLPRVLGIREHTIPRAVPYLNVPPDALCRMHERLEALCGHRLGRLRVGVAWAGSPKHSDDTGRSMRLDQLDPLFQLSGVQFVSLQQGVAIPSGCPMIPVVADSDHLANTAAIILQLDLVITVDTMIAHLAGALGRPVWTLLKFAPDWRWMTGREDSPWYPGMRLFRQSHFGAWGDVVQRVCLELSTSPLKRSD